ncbi:tyrosine-type recombinase/integrase [Weissella paramesenteroides]|uniref:tyrosine-type recombinase/integrase n=1 Tax=Weissella paramesenteroides TaxID=1249 RepID=UPI001C1F86D0|nr:site-specific integrase [Weissella paramesenteroides]MBU7556850.1 site-specific integrase [Weissella paramesenteroides]
MTVKRLGKAWAIDTYEHGVRRRLSGFATKKEAQYMERFLLNESDDLPTRANVTVNQLHAEWLETYIAGGVTKSSLYKTNGFWRRDIKPIFGSKDITQVTSPDIQKWLNKGSNKYVSFVKNAMQLRSIFKYGVHQGYIDASPFDKVTVPHRRPAKEKLTWSDEDYQQWLNYLNDELWHKSKKQSVYLLLLTKTGLRRQEISALTVSDIDLKRRTITINKALKYADGGAYLGSTKSKDSNRVIGIDQQTVERILLYLPNLGSNPHVLFPAGGGSNQSDEYMSFNRGYKWFKKAMQEAGVPDIGGLHGLRHQFTTVAIKKGISPKLVQKQLGHSDVSITMNVYTHVNNEEVIAIADRLAD